MRSEKLDSRAPAIGVYGVGKTYRIYDSPLNRFQGHVIEALPKPCDFVQKWAAGHLRSLGREFHALHNVSLEIQQGESVGIIGRNGSGKSTLLQIIAGTRPPTTGSVQVRGRVAAILELGSGFKPDFTGRENVFINGLILGLKKAEIEERFDEIERFADIGKFIDQPVKTYSSGMLVRLVFAVQVALEPEILIVDEALAVGDVFFQQKCARRMQDLRDQGTTILFVSHSMQVVRNLCEKVVFLRDGHMEFFGPTLKGTNLYFSGAGQSSSSRPEFLEAPNLGKVAPEDAVWKCATDAMESARVLWVRAASAGGFESGLCGIVGEVLTLEVAVQSFDAAPCSFHVGFNIKNGYDQLVSSCGTHNQGHGEFQLEPGEIKKFRLDITLALEPGNYTILTGIGKVLGAGGWQRIHGTGWFGPLSISWNSRDSLPPFAGPFGLPVHIEEIDSTDGP